MNDGTIVKFRCGDVVKVIKTINHDRVSVGDIGIIKKNGGLEIAPFENLFEVDFIKVVKTSTGQTVWFMYDYQLELVSASGDQVTELTEI